MKKRCITFKSIDSLVNCYTHHQIIQYFSELGVLFTVKFRPPGSPFPTRQRLSNRITKLDSIRTTKLDVSVLLFTCLKDVILIDKRRLLGKGLLGGRNLTVNFREILNNVVVSVASN